jgi:DNA-binding NtrC family response regulator
MSARTKVLLIDDEREVRESLAEALKDEYCVTAATSGEEAIEVIKNDTPNVVILDMQLPGINGMETLELIKQIDKSVPVIIISGTSTIHTAVKAQKLGVYDYFDKPFEVNELRASLKNAVDRTDVKENNEENEFPLDVESFIHDAIDDEMQKRAGLNKALKSFRKKYVEFMAEKYMRNMLRQ